MSKRVVVNTVCFLIVSFLSFSTSGYSKSHRSGNSFTGLLVSIETLETHLDAPGIIVLDARLTGYSKGHIPGAVHLSWSDCVDRSKELKPLFELEKQLGAKGLKRDLVYVIYDDANSSRGTAGFMFWLLEYLGCENVHMLDGGWNRWKASGGAVEIVQKLRPAATFNAKVKKEVRMDKNTLKSKLTDKNYLTVDCRTDEEYNGWAFRGESRGGHIPGAVQIPYEWLFKKDKRLLDRGELKTLFEDRGLTRNKEVTAYSTFGVRSGFVYFALRLLGYPKVSNYDASISQWSADHSLPMESLPNFEKLVNAQWVRKLIEGQKPDTYPGKGYVILEAAYKKDDASGTIPGAVSVHPCYFESGNDTSKYYPSYSKPDDGNLLPDSKLRKAIAALGITEDTTVVVYGNGIIIPMTSCRVAWALMYAGVKDVRILNGGYTAWKAGGGKTVYQTEDLKPVDHFGTTRRVHAEYLASTAYVKDISMGIKPGSILVDIRDRREYTGSKIDKYLFFKKAGHIPNAVWYGDWVKLVDRNDDTLRSYTEIRKIWRDLGITFDKEPVFYCGTGWRSSIGFFAAHLMGFKSARNYDDGFYGWWWNGGKTVSTENP